MNENKFFVESSQLPISITENFKFNQAKKLMVSCVIEAQGTHAEHAPARLVFIFCDDDGKVVAGKVPELSYSEESGNSIYVGQPGQSGLIAFSVELSPPPQAASVAVSLHGWYAKTVKLIKSVQFDARQEIEEPTPEPRNQNPETRNQKPETRNQKPETRNQKPTRNQPEYR